MLSRRQFLQAAGIALAAAHLPRLASASPALHFQPLYGRALGTVPVYVAPQNDPALVTSLWSDSVVPIQETDGVWYRLPEGYAQREFLQPMLSPAQNTPINQAPPFWGEVTSAVAIVRAWCTAAAPIITRIGHGGVLYIADSLALEGINWYGVAESENCELLGWSQSAAWTRAESDSVSPNLTLLIDRQAQQLTAFDDDQPVLTAPVSAALSLVPGTYAVTDRNFTAAPTNYYHGIPWALTFGENQYLSGAFWHNHFGMEPNGASAGVASIEVAPALARWLYPRASSVIIS